MQPISKKTESRKEGDVCMTINYQSILFVPRSDFLFCIDLKDGRKERTDGRTEGGKGGKEKKDGRKGV